MQPVVSGCIMICLWGRLPGVLLPPAMFLNVMTGLPSAAINLVTAHDGFTLRDCVCSTINTMKQTEKKIATGTNNNYSNNHGKEGLGGTLDLVERRRDSIHALLTTLLLSQGTPMLLAGDEHGHSQHGNNNAYCQDNQLTWLDWSQASSGLPHLPPR